MKSRLKKYLVPHKSNNFRPYLFRSAGIIATIVLVAGAFFTLSAYREMLSRGSLLADVLPAVLADLANGDRRESKLNSLKVNPNLVVAAELKAKDMATKSYFAHVSPEGVSPWHWFGEAHYDFIYAGENLAINFEDSSAVNDAWMQSPSHRANILNSNFTEIGIATARGLYQGEEKTFVVEMFGSPAQKESGPQKKSQPTSSDEALVVEKTLVPIAESTVLGASESQTFISVKNPNAVPLSQASNLATANTADSTSYASTAERLLSSPTKLLAITYIILGLILLTSLVFVLFVKHDRRTRHTIYLFTLLIILFGAYYVYRFSIFSSVHVLGLNSLINLDSSTHHL